MPSSKFQAQYDDLGDVSIELDEFGSINSFNVKSKKFKTIFEKAKSVKLVDRLKYYTTGIPQLGTTYPIPPDREDLINRENKPYPWYCRPWWGILVSILAMVIDSFCFYMLFDFYLPDTFTIVSAIGAAVAVDISPIFLAHNCKRKGPKQSIIIILMQIISIALFIVFIIMAYSIRMGCYSDDQASAIMQILIPIATSSICFFINYLSFNPVAERIKENKLIKLQLQENICEMQAAIIEMTAVENYAEVLKENDEQMYNAAKEKIEKLRDGYRALVRVKIAEALHSPADTSDLSVPLK